MKGFTETSASEESVKWQNFDPPIYNIWKQQTNAAGPALAGQGVDRGEVLCLRQQKVSVNR
jgi:hypothetical protein